MRVIVEPGNLSCQKQRQLVDPCCWMQKDNTLVVVFENILCPTYVQEQKQLKVPYTPASVIQKVQLLFELQ